MKKIILSKNVPAPIGPYSQAVETDNMLFVSGQLPLDFETGRLSGPSIDQQTETVICNIKEILQEANMTMNNVVKTNVYLKDINHFNSFNTVYEKYFNDCPPARSCVEVSALPKDALIEMEVIAIKSKS